MPHQFVYMHHDFVHMRHQFVYMHHQFVYMHHQSETLRARNQCYESGLPFKTSSPDVIKLNGEYVHVNSKMQEKLYSFSNSRADNPVYA